MVVHLEHYLFISKCRLLITFANNLEPDQTRRNVRPDLDPDCETLIVFLKDFFEKVDFEKKSADDKKAGKISQGAKN